MYSVPTYPGKPGKLATDVLVLEKDDLEQQSPIFFCLYTMNEIVIYIVMFTYIVNKRQNWWVTGGSFVVGSYYSN